jgi:hypothetical protein
MVPRDGEAALLTRLGSTVRAATMELTKMPLKTLLNDACFDI